MSATALERPCTPDEIAACCLFLASAEASYVNGAMLVVDGANALMEFKGAGEIQRQVRPYRLNRYPLSRQRFTIG